MAMHDLDRVQAEVMNDHTEQGPFRGVSDEWTQGEDESQALWDPAATGAVGGPIAHEDEISLASELLSAESEDEVDETLHRVVHARPRPAGCPPCRCGRPHPRSPARPTHTAQQRRRRTHVANAVKGIARKALPALGAAAGTLVPVVGPAAGAAIGRGVAKAFGLELEGLSPEDQQLEVARRIVRLGADAAGQADRVDPSVDDKAAAKIGVMRAARRHAPGVAPRGTAGGPPHAGAAHATGGGAGRWVRRNGRIVLLGV